MNNSEPTQIRIFISSPGDVKTERQKTRSIINRIASELGIPVSIRYAALLDSDDEETDPKPPGHGTGELVLYPYFWEYQSYQADEGYQEQIHRPDRFDLVVCILWAKMGSKLSAKFENPDGSTPRSGTEFEIQWASHARKRALAANPDRKPSEIRPALFVYRNRNEPKFPAKPKELRNEQIEQYDMLEEFVAGWQRASDGSFQGAFNSYWDLGEFEEKFDAHLRDFLSPFAIKAGIREKPIDPQTLLWNPKERGSPFRRLDVYEPEHEPIFCGRARDTGRVIETLQSQAQDGIPFVLIKGSSGSGKSSLVRAGALPMIFNGNVIPDIEQWRYAIMRPGDAEHHRDPLRSLANALMEKTALPGLRDRESKENPVEKLTRQLTENPQGLIDRIEDQLIRAGDDNYTEQKSKLELRRTNFLQAGSVREGDAKQAEAELKGLVPPRVRLLLFIDQFEELFHVHDDSKKGAEIDCLNDKSISLFLTALDRILRSGRVFVIITLRSDFYATYQSAINEWAEAQVDHKESLDYTPGYRDGSLLLLSKLSQIDLLPPRHDEIGKIIRQPAAAAGLRYGLHPETNQPLDEELRDVANKNPDSLPLLSHLLDRLYEKQKVRGDGWLTWEDYTDLGGIEGALTQHAEEVCTQLESERTGAFDAFPRIISGLVSLRQGKRIRREALFSDLTSDWKKESHTIDSNAVALIETLASQEVRLLTLTADSEHPEKKYVSVSHEILLQKWDRVSEWIQENELFLRKRERIEAMMLNYFAAREEYQNESVGSETATDSRDSGTKSKSGPADKETPGSLDDFLLPLGSQLKEALDLIKAKDQTVSQELRDYIRKSEKRAQKLNQKARRSKSRLLVGSTALILAAMIAGTFAWKSSRETSVAEKKLKATVAQQIYSLACEENYKGRSQRAAKLTAQALRKDPDLPGAHLLANWLLFADPYQRIAFTKNEAPSFYLRESPGGQLICAAGSDGVVRVYSIPELKLLEEYEHPDAVWEAAFTPDGKGIASVCADGALRLWKRSETEPFAVHHRRSEIPESDAIEGAKSVSYSPDGSRLAWAVGNRICLFEAGQISDPEATPSQYRIGTTVHHFSWINDEQILLGTEHGVKWAHLPMNKVNSGPNIIDLAPSLTAPKTTSEFFLPPLPDFDNETEVYERKPPAIYPIAERKLERLRDDEYEIVRSETAILLPAIGYSHHTASRATLVDPDAKLLAVASDGGMIYWGRIPDRGTRLPTGAKIKQSNSNIKSPPVTRPYGIDFGIGISISDAPINGLSIIKPDKFVAACEDGNLYIQGLRPGELVRKDQLSSVWAVTSALDSQWVISADNAGALISDRVTKLQSPSTAISSNWKHLDSDNYISWNHDEMAHIKNLLRVKAAQPRGMPNITFARSHDAGFGWVISGENFKQKKFELPGSLLFHALSKAASNHYTAITVRTINTKQTPDQQGSVTTVNAQGTMPVFGSVYRQHMQVAGGGKIPVSSSSFCVSLINWNLDDEKFPELNRTNLNSDATAQSSANALYGGSGDEFPIYSFQSHIEWQIDDIRSIILPETNFWAIIGAGHETKGRLHLLPRSTTPIEKTEWESIAIDFPVTTAATSEDGRHFALHHAPSREIQVVNRQGEILHRDHLPIAAHSMAFLQSGTLLAFSGEKGTGTWNLGDPEGPRLFSNEMLQLGAIEQDLLELSTDENAGFVHRHEATGSNLIPAWKWNKEELEHVLAILDVISGESSSNSASSIPHWKKLQKSNHRVSESFSLPAWIDQITDAVD